MMCMENEQNKMYLQLKFHRNTLELLRELCLIVFSSLLLFVTFIVLSLIVVLTQNKQSFSCVTIAFSERCDRPP